MVFDLLSDYSKQLIQLMGVYEPYDEGHNFPWSNYLWRAPDFRRAHLDIVDVRKDKKLYMMHLCIFPNTNDPSPIFGLDIIAGPNKVTGAFHDFSPVSGDTPLDSWFAAESKNHSWSKERVLPDWAKAIFSKSMVAAGNIQDLEELDNLLSMATSNLKHYLSSIGGSTEQDYSERQNHYCQYQKQNPHTPRTMSALGFPAEVVASFIETCLFPEVSHV